jgi:hypothetical protein
VVAAVEERLGVQIAFHPNPPPANRGGRDPGEG